MTPGVVTRTSPPTIQQASPALNEWVATKASAAPARRPLQAVCEARTRIEPHAASAHSQTSTWSPHSQFLYWRGEKTSSDSTGRTTQAPATPKPRKVRWTPAASTAKSAAATPTLTTHSRRWSQPDQAARGIITSLGKKARWSVFCFHRSMKRSSPSSARSTIGTSPHWSEKGMTKWCWLAKLAVISSGRAQSNADAEAATHARSEREPSGTGPSSRDGRLAAIASAASRNPILGSRS